MPSGSLSRRPAQTRLQLTRAMPGCPRFAMPCPRASAIHGTWINRRSALLHLLLHLLRLRLRERDVHAQAVVEVEVGIGDEDQGEEGEDVAAPVVKEQAELCDDQKENRHVVAEAVFAGEDVEELFLEEGAAILASVVAPITGLAEEFFEDHRARDAGDGDREDQQPEKLVPGMVGGRRMGHAKSSGPVIILAHRQSEWGII